MTYISQSSDFSLYLEDCLVDEHRLDKSLWHNLWPQNKCRSQWPIFHSSVILPHILKTIWWMSIICLYNETVWPNIWPQYKYRSFHGPVVSPYILKTVWWLNVILWDNESVWCKLWVDNICRLSWPIVYGLLILLYSLKSIWWNNVILSDKTGPGSSVDRVSAPGKGRSWVWSWATTYQSP